MEHWKNLGAGVDGQPEPEHVCGAAQPGVEFIQLQMREVQVAEIVLVQRLSMLPSAREPDRDGRFWKPKTRSAAEGSSPSASAERTIAT
jgi:hypothetical protein